ncbi:MAG: hypothetical protein Q7S04_01460 [Candidatus Moranbacteria bacterium]|nr:hypothetical protein [Candidatus Moranbacteria bacterium]
MDFISIYVSVSKQILNDYQWLVGIFFTAGLSLLVYFRLLRINNFLAYSQKYHENLKSFLFLEKINYKNGEMVYRDSGEDVEEQDALNLTVLYNLLSEVGLLYRRGLINRDLVYQHFGNVVYSLYTQHRDIISHIQSHTKTDNIEFLFEAFSKRGVRCDRMKKLRNFFFGRKSK